MDGSDVDAFGRQAAGRRDVSAGNYVTLPPGSRIVESDPETHRYLIDVPRAPSMPISLNVMPLAMQRLVTASEVRANLVGAIELEHLVPPPPPPSTATVVVREAEGVPASAWLAGLIGLSGALGFGVFRARRRRDPSFVLLGRAKRAHGAIARECAALGPAFDPVSASAARLVEAAERTDAHRREVERAIERTAWASAAGGERARMHEKAEAARRELSEIVARLEVTATSLASRRADASRAAGVEDLLAELGDDLHAAVSAERELAELG